MLKSFLFYFGTGLLTPYFLSLLVKGNVSIVLSVVAVAIGFVSLYIGKLADKVGVKKLFFISVPISILAAFFLHYFATQIVYGISIAVIGLLIDIETSNRSESSGKKFGRLSFYIQMASAFSLALGGVVSGFQATIIYAGPLTIFLLLTIRKNNLLIDKA